MGFDGALPRSNNLIVSVIQKVRQVIIELDLIPISLNKLYRQFRGRTIISKEGREFKKHMAVILAGFDTSSINGMFTETQGLAVEISFHSNRFYTKDGRIRKRFLDCDNLLKATLDTVFAEIGIDDSYITKLTVTKSQGYYDKTIIKFGRNCD
jgi:Holliday junction resolvase RusA-like endonuclease